MIRGRKILIVDDSVLSLALEQQVLERAGYDVRAAQSYVEFERILRRWQPDIVLTDVKMPDVSGTDLCRNIKRSLDGNLVPVVIFSTLPDDTLAELAVRCGADAFLSKRRGLEALAERLEEVWGAILW